MKLVSEHESLEEQRVALCCPEPFPSLGWWCLLLCLYSLWSVVLCCLIERALEMLAHMWSVNSQGGIWSLDISTPSHSFTVKRWTTRQEPQPRRIHHRFWSLKWSSVCLSIFAKPLDSPPFSWSTPMPVLHFAPWFSWHPGLGAWEDGHGGGRLTRFGCSCYGCWWTCFQHAARVVHLQMPPSVCATSTQLVLAGGHRAVPFAWDTCRLSLLLEAVTWYLIKWGNLKTALFAQGSSAWAFPPNQLQGLLGTAMWPRYPLTKNTARNGRVNISSSQTRWRVTSCCCGN